MTTNRTPLYYLIRTAVRVLFWGAVSVLLALGLGSLAELIGNNDNPCRITLNRNFTWQPETGFTTVDACDHPTNVILNDNYTWEWEN